MHRNRVSTAVGLFLLWGGSLLIPAAALRSECVTTVPPGLVSGETWTVANSPYCVTGDIQVTLLTIEPGVEILMDGPYQIEVLSTITAVGTAADPIRFSVKAPDPPDAQRWRGLKFVNAPTGSEFTHVIIEYSEDGGINLLNSPAPIIRDCVFRNNSRVGSGGGISVEGVSSDLSLTGCSFSGNTASVNGGALWVSLNDGFLLDIEACVFDSNTANPAHASGNRVGGALHLNRGDARISSSEFTHNVSNSRCSGTFGCNVLARGGAIYSESPGTMTLENCVIRENQADARNNGDCFFGGSSKSYGGGLYADAGTVILKNCILSCNSTTRTNCGPSDGGGGLYDNGGSIVVENCTIARNPNATGIHLVDGSLDVVNSIIYFNDNDGVQVGGAPTITYSDVQGPDSAYAGEGNINVNPVFAGTGCTLDDLTILIGSPAIDGGNPAPVYADSCFPPSLGTNRNDMGAHGGPGACGWFSQTGIGDGRGAGPTMPRSFALGQNFPNPFNPSTTITYELPGDHGDLAPVNLTIYNVRGRRVRTLINSERLPGRHVLHWDGRDDLGRSVPSGVFLYTLRTGDGAQTRKMTLIR